MQSRLVLWTLTLLLTSAATFGQTKRLLTVEDLFEFKNVGDPRISPEGEWVAYTVSQLDAKEDASDTDIYMVSWDGGEAIRLTTSPKGESRPRWSPDGRWLAFVSGREEGKKSQVWLLDRRGGEAERLTDLKGGVSGFTWSPDSASLALVSRDPDPEEEKDKETGKKKPQPIEVRRLQFKRDGAGYLDERRNHLYLFDLQARESRQLTSGPYDDASPVWSPDGSWLAFVSNRTEEPDSNANTDIFLVNSDGEPDPIRLTTSPRSDSFPSFSSDGRWLAYLQGGNPDDIWYATNNLAVLSLGDNPTQPGPPRVLSAGLDRNLSRPRFAPGESRIYAQLEDRGTVQLISFGLEGNDPRPVVEGQRTVRAFDLGSDGRIVVLESTTRYPSEISKVVDGNLTRLTRVNDELLASIELASVEMLTTPSTESAEIDFFLTRPTGGNQPFPTLLRIHGGPVSQFSYRFSFEWQLFAAHGYAVVAANPRGSSGRGRDFSYGIWADWGTRDFADVNAAVDKAIEMGVADRGRLGVGGWSYGGILTNYVITKTGRFKAAISGASEVNYTANYGHDHYQRQWEGELGLPWENTENWIRISPFFSVDKVTTPTLILGGQIDWNVPLQNSEQLYQALRRLGVETELIIYPGQGHGIRRPSFQLDRYQRYLKWYDHYLKPEEVSTGQR